VLLINTKQCVNFELERLAYSRGLSSERQDISSLAAKRERR
jgi:hypothetical protein